MRWRLWLLALVASCSSSSVPSSPPAPAPVAAQGNARAARHLPASPATARPLTLDTRPQEQVDQSACADSAGSWRCRGVRQAAIFASGGRPPLTPASWSVPYWAVDNSSSTTCASDANTCTSATCGAAGIGPCKTVGEVASRWGTNTPSLAQVTVLQLLSDDVAENVALDPRVMQGGAFYFIGTPTQVNWGTSALGAVTSKNRATSTLLQANLGQAASVAVGSMLYDTTHPGRAWVDSATGNVATLTQPMVPNTPAAPSHYVPFPAEVDTWATSDVFAVMRPTKVRLTELLPRQAAGDTTVSTGTLSYIGGIWNIDPSGVGTSQFLTNTSVYISESRFDSFVVYEGSSIQPASFLGSTGNCWFAGAGAFNGAWMSGGAIATTAAPRTYPVTFLGSNGLDGDLVLHGLAAVQTNGSQNNAESLLSLVFLDNEVDVYTQVNVSQNEYGSTAIYGTYTLNVKRGGVLTYVAPATSTFLGTPTLKFTTSTTGCSVTNASPAVWNCGINLTPTTLAAAAGASGFGGSAIDRVNGAWIGTGVQ